MLLTRILRAGRDDRGSGLVAVISLTLVTAIIGATVGAVTVHSLQVTNGVAGSVEARAAAQSGIADVEQLIRTFDDTTFVNECPSGGILESATAPAYRVEVYSDDLANGWTDDPTCPSVDSTRVKFVSTGFADRGTPGAGGQNSSVTIEAIYQYIPQPLEIEAIDPAVYAYQIEGDLKNFELGIEPNTVIASDIQIRNGNFICTNGASVAGSVILGQGYANLDRCRVNGDLHVSDYIVASASDTVITGNAIAAARILDGSSRAVTVTSRAQVQGDVYAGGPVALTSNQTPRVDGNIVAARNNTTSVSLTNQARVGGNVLASGPISGGNSTNVAGTRSGGVTGLTPPPSPQIPDWVDLPFDPALSAIQASTWWERGFRNVVRWSGTCNLGGTDLRWAALQLYVVPTIIDATGCVGGVNLQSNLSPTVNLLTDVVIFADSISLNKLYARAATMTDARRMYFIVPDNTADGVPSCTGEAGNITYNNEDDIAAPLAIFFYTPCKVLSDRNKMRGQIYGGSVEFRQQAQWTFVPATPPGIDFSAGGAVETIIAGATLGERLSIRELTTGG